MDWKNKVVVVTGGSSGIGEAIARVLDVRGAIVVLASRNEEELKRVLGRLSDRAYALSLDVSDPVAVEEFFCGVEKGIGPVEGLINNAGFGVFNKFVEASVIDFERMMAVNYFGTLYCSKAVLPGMLERKSGFIVNIASLAGKVGTPKSSGYSATKHAVLGFTNALRMEMDGKGVFIGAMNPGPVKTKFFEKADPSGDYVKNVQWMMLTPESVALEVALMIEKQIPEVDLPKSMKWLTRLYGAAPRLMDKVAKRWLNQK